MKMKKQLKSNDCHKNNLFLEILMPTYNREKTIGCGLQAICSEINNSQYKDYIKITISENHSTDSTKQIVQRIANEHKFITIISPEKHLPSGEHNLFFLLENATGDYSWSLADDDLIVHGTVDLIYELLVLNDNDFLLINSQYYDSNGALISNAILKLKQETVHYDSMQYLFADIGPTTLLASFSSVIYKTSKMQSINLQAYLEISPIYAHVFAYLEAFNNANIVVLKMPLILLKKTTYLNHWENVSKKMNWYMHYPWTAGLAKHMIAAQSKNIITIDLCRQTLCYNESGRFLLLAYIVHVFIEQLQLAVNKLDSEEIPSKEDFEAVKQIIESASYITTDTIEILQWCKEHIFKIINLKKMMDKHGQNLTEAIGILGCFANLDRMALLGTVNQLIDLTMEKLEKIKNGYTVFNTFSGNLKVAPMIIGEEYVLLGWGSSYLVVGRTTYENGLTNSFLNVLDLHSLSLEIFVFKNQKEAMKEFNNLESNCIFDTNIKYAVTFLSRTYYHNEKELLIMLEQKCTEDLILEINTNDENIALKNDYGIILEYFEEQSIGNDWMNSNILIDINWYINTYINQANSGEIKLLKENPMIHYLLLGWKKNWCLSPYIDEVFFRNAYKDYKPALLTYINNNNCEISELFSLKFYTTQVKIYEIENADNLSIEHFLKIGSRLGIRPHRFWNEKRYLELNPDVGTASIGVANYGWHHWCRHGRFEKRPGAF